MVLRKVGKPLELCNAPNAKATCCTAPALICWSGWRASPNAPSWLSRRRSSSFTESREERTNVNLDPKPDRNRHFAWTNWKRLALAHEDLAPQRMGAENAPTGGSVFPPVGVVPNLALDLEHLKKREKKAWKAYKAPLLTLDEKNRLRSEWANITREIAKVEKLIAEDEELWEKTL